MTDSVRGSHPIDSPSLIAAPRAAHSASRGGLKMDLLLAPHGGAANALARRDARAAAPPRAGLCRSVARARIERRRRRAASADSEGRRRSRQNTALRALAAAQRCYLRRGVRAVVRPAPRGGPRTASATSAAPAELRGGVLLRLRAAPARARTARGEAQAVLRHTWPFHQAVEHNALGGEENMSAGGASRIARRIRTKCTVKTIKLPVEREGSRSGGGGEDRGL